MESSFAIGTLLLSYGIFSLGPYLVWPSRWNIVGHIQLGLYVVSYLIPLLWTDPTLLAGTATLKLYLWVMAFGAFIYLLTLRFGASCPRLSLRGGNRLLMNTPHYERLFHKRVVMVILFAVIGLLVSYSLMGFVPMFAADPVAAKYLKGDYSARFLHANDLLAFSLSIVACYLPLLMVTCVTTKRLSYCLLVILGFSAALVSLERAPVGMALITGVGIVIAAQRSRLLFLSYLAAATILVCIGTLGNYVLSVYVGINMGQANNEQELAELITEGAPDVDEGLRFFDSFLEHKQYSYGAQFVGGLVPFKSVIGKWIPFVRWNPGEWALVVLYGNDDEEFVDSTKSGGLRLAVPISGYAAFGWIGVLLSSSIAGFLTGYVVNFAKRYVGRSSSLERSAIVIAMYFVLSGIAQDPVAILWDQFVPVLILAWLIYPIRFVLTPDLSVQNQPIQEFTSA